MTDKKMTSPFVPGEDTMTPKRLQDLYSHSYSCAILKEAKRILTKQRKEHAPLLAAFRASQRRQKAR